MQNTSKILKTLILFILTIAVGLFIFYSFPWKNKPNTLAITSYNDCINSDHTLNSTGDICTTSGGEQFTKPIETSTTTSPVISTTSVATTTKKIVNTLLLNKPTIFKVGNKKILKNGPTITLIALHDSLCKPNTQCIWQGEISAEFMIVTALKTNTITLGTEKNKSEIIDGFHFTLVSATTNSATLIINKSVNEIGTGMVMGTVKIGPICPIESIDHPCVINPEVYTSRSVIVYQGNISTELEHHILSADGTYSFKLKTGIYGLQISPAGIGAGEIKTITVSANGTTTVNFDIDTGIR